MFLSKLKQSAQPGAKNSAVDLPEDTMFVDNSHILKEERRSKSAAKRQHQRSKTDSFAQLGSRGIETVKDKHASYYTVYRDPNGLSPIQHENDKFEYFDHKGKAIAPVDLLFDETPRSGNSSSKFFKKFAKNRNDQSHGGNQRRKMLPCIGATELQMSQKRADAQLNVMPSLISGYAEGQYDRTLENAFVDSAFEDLTFDRSSGAYRKKDVLPSTPNSVRTELPDSPSTASEDDTPMTPDDDAYTYFSSENVWNCITYLASFLPPIPVPDLTVDSPEQEEEVQQKQQLQINKKLPDIPPQEKPSKFSKRKAHRSNERLQTPPQMERETAYNRNSHPNFGKSHPFYKPEKRSFSEKLGKYSY